MKKGFLLTAVFFAFAFFVLTTPQNVLAGNAGLTTCPNGNQGFDTAIGCISFINNAGNADQMAIARFFLQWGLGAGGGIAFVLIVFAGFQIITSSGDPRRLQAGKELLTSALTGLLLLIFSAFILRIVGVDILDLTQFGF